MSKRDTLNIQPVAMPKLVQYKFKFREYLNKYKSSGMIKKKVMNETGVSSSTLERYIGYSKDDVRDVPAMVLYSFANQFGVAMEDLLNLPAKTESNGK